ncbi:MULTISPECIES: hypothetical protein [Rahnella]|uniref:Uncharacterized protein n=1 Tax=Rahnella laticis TaxID=2787622 RepID=A0ABS0E5W7_9GAMM|nr:MULTISPECIES: hypothetical protein [Rahnella]MBF7980497.1 hypothetical protein [Rahnella laticis]MBF8000243.1 hypothetical protein [Rahnella sp. LAC-M12]
MNTIIYALPSDDGQNIVAYFGTSPQDPALWPGVIALDASDVIYKAYYQQMSTLGMHCGMIEPD